MAIATNTQDCINRHVAYPFDIAATEMDELQRARLSAMYRMCKGKDKMLDIGCNSGYAVDFAPKAKWYGVDCSQELVIKAGKRGMITDIGNAENLNHFDNFFKTAVLGEILEHVFDPVQVVREAARVAWYSVVGSVPTENSRWGKHTIQGHEFHVRAFNEKELDDLLSPFGRVKIRIVAGQFYVFEVIL